MGDDAMPFDSSRLPETVLPVRARGLCYAAGGRTLVQDLDLSIEPGGCVVLMGPNGAGKSLTLRLLHGLLRPTAGTVSWGGRGMSLAVRRRQAMVFQRPVLLRRSAAANIDYALKAHGVPHAERRARTWDALTMAGLETLADSPALKLSGGEQQRLSAARALAARPALLFLDEPTASLDPASTLAIEDLVRRARADGTTVVLVTHDAGQARRLADRVLFLHGGRLLEDAQADQFFAHPRSEAARAFLDGRIHL